MSAEPSRAASPPDGSGCAAAPVLAVDRVSVELGGRQILDQVSFELHGGELTGLIGANGSGKTTLFRVILGLQQPRRGTVSLLGGDRASSRHQVGYVPQKFSLDPDAPLRARDLVALGLDGHRFGFALPSPRRRALVDEMLQAVSAAGFADTRVGSLSGGEQQRVLIAHALISKPRLLLLDEPLANLDLASGQEVVTLLASIAAERGVSVLISAHEINSLLPVIDRIVYLAAGRAASGTAEQVVRADVLSRLYGRHVDVIHVHGRVLVVAGAGEPTDLAGHEGDLALQPRESRASPVQPSSQQLRTAGPPAPTSDTPPVKREDAR